MRFLSCVPQVSPDSFFIRGDLEKVAVEMQRQGAEFHTTTAALASPSNSKKKGTSDRFDNCRLPVGSASGGKSTSPEVRTYR